MRCAPLPSDVLSEFDALMAGEIPHPSDRAAIDAAAHRWFSSPEAGIPVSDLSPEEDAALHVSSAQPLVRWS